MTPYSGPESPLGLILLAAVLAAIFLLALVFTLDKKEKARESEVEGSGKAIRLWKRISALFMVIAVVFSGYWAMSIENMGKDAHNAGMVTEIESHGVELVQGFEDPDVPLKSNSTAKFMVQSDSGLVRCRANSAGAGEAIEYMCQAENREFLIPIEDL